MSWGRKGKYVAPSIPVFSGFFSHGNEDLSSSHGSSQKHMKFRDNTGGSQGKATESLLRQELGSDGGAIVKFWLCVSEGGLHIQKMQDEQKISAYMV